MIYFENTDLFTRSCTLGGDSSELYAINIKIDPKMFDLRTVKKVPFCTIVIKIGGNENINFLNNDKINDDKFYDKISKLSQLYSMKLLNMYEDTEYPDVVNQFDTGCLFHTVLIFIDLNEKATIETPNPNLLVTGLPISGFVSPIGKSANYDIYNGKFIHCKAFKYNDKFNNGIVFIFAKVRSYISVDEYLVGESSNEDTLKWGHMLQHTWWIALKDKDEISVSTSHRRYPVMYNGNESLFSKSKKNLFYLSDIPSDVIQRGETITTRMI